MSVQQFNIFPICSSNVLAPLTGWHPGQLPAWLAPIRPCLKVEALHSSEALATIYKTKICAAKRITFKIRKTVNILFYCGVRGGLSRSGTAKLLTSRASIQDVRSIISLQYQHAHSTLTIIIIYWYMFLRQCIIIRLSIISCGYTGEQSCDSWRWSLQSKH
jgi:hypothetical protein